MEYLSHGLLYAVTPEHFYQLHVTDERHLDSFDWGEYASQCEGNSLASHALAFLNKLSLTKA